MIFDKKTIALALAILMLPSCTTIPEKAAVNDQQLAQTPAATNTQPSIKTDHRQLKSKGVQRLNHTKPNLTCDNGKKYKIIFTKGNNAKLVLPDMKTVEILGDEKPASGLAFSNDNYCFFQYHLVMRITHFLPHKNKTTICHNIRDPKKRRPLKKQNT